MATSTKSTNIMMKQEGKNKNQAQWNSVIKAENEDNMHQTNIRVIPPYYNPLS